MKNKIPEKIEEFSESISDSHWNHRIIMKQDKYYGTYFEMHEVYYNENNEPWGWTSECEVYSFENYQNLLEMKKQVENAMNQTVLKLEIDENGEEDLIDTGLYIKDF